MEKHHFLFIIFTLLFYNLSTNASRRGLLAKEYPGLYNGVRQEVCNDWATARFKLPG
jgi:hypothetical protein